MGSGHTPVVALLTDFGAEDWFVGTMKGVIAGICPRATLIDLTHSLDPYDIRGASLALWSAWGYFPPGTVFVCVVDPGVGTDRRAVCAAGDSYFYVAPDNGLLTMPARRASRWRAYELQNPDWRLGSVSDTFHGRDVFAPAAGRLAAGADPAGAGPPLEQEQRFDFPEARAEHAHTWAGEVIYVDHFGNLLLSLHRDQLDQNEASEKRWRVRVGNVWIAGGLARTFAERSAHELLFYWGSSDFLEIAANQTSAAELVGVGVGASFELHTEA